MYIIRKTTWDKNYDEQSYYYQPYAFLNDAILAFKSISLSEYDSTPDQIRENTNINFIDSSTGNILQRCDIDYPGSFWAEIELLYVEIYNHFEENLIKLI